MADWGGLYSTNAHLILIFLVQRFDQSGLLIFLNGRTWMYRVFFAIVVNGLLDTFPSGSCSGSSMGTSIFRWGYELIKPCLLLVVKVG